MTRSAVAAEARDHARVRAALRRFPRGLVALLAALAVAAAACALTVVGARVGPVTWSAVAGATVDAVALQRVVGILVAVTMLLLLALVLRQWAADVRVARSLEPTAAVLGATAQPTGAAVGTAAVAAAVLMSGGLVAAPQILSTSSRPDGAWLAVAIPALPALLVLVLGRPRGTTAVLLTASGMVVVTDGARHEVDWSVARYYAPAPGGGGGSVLSWAGRRRRVRVDDAEVFRRVRREVNDAVGPLARAALAAGEPVGFDGVTLTPDAVVVSRRRIPLLELAEMSVVARYRQVGYRFATHTGAVGLSSTQVANIDVLVALLRTGTRARILGAPPVGEHPGADE